MNGANAAADDRPSRRVVEQRIRNRVIEYFELAASYEDQWEYQRAVPSISVAAEVINQWTDNFPRGPSAPGALSVVFSPPEAEAILAFHAVWAMACDAVPAGYPTLAEAQAMPEWEQLRRAAAAARDVFAQRGRMSEEEEQELP